MLRLAYENGKLLRLPLIRQLKEHGPRQGFFEPEEFGAVRRRLPPDLQAAVTLAYTFGWRMQSDVLALERRQLDLEAGTLRLDPETTKNDEGRLVYLTPELRGLLADQVERVRALERQTGWIIPSLFPHLRGPYRGSRIQDFKRRWQTACRKAGLASKRRHDFRRTAVRNMVNAGIPERVAMTMSGHKTRSVFDRYHIVSPGDLREAAQKLTGMTTGRTPGRAPRARLGKPRKDSGARPAEGRRPLARGARVPRRTAARPVTGAEVATTTEGYSGCLVMVAGARTEAVQLHQPAAHRGRDQASRSHVLILPDIRRGERPQRVLTHQPHRTEQRASRAGGFLPGSPTA